MYQLEPESNGGLPRPLYNVAVFELREQLPSGVSTPVPVGLDARKMCDGVRAAVCANADEGKLEYSHSTPQTNSSREYVT